jgi:hypothetical protein
MSPEDDVASIELEERRGLSLWYTLPASQPSCLLSKKIKRDLPSNICSNCLLMSLAVPEEGANLVGVDGAEGGLVSGEALQVDAGLRVYAVEHAVSVVGQLSIVLLYNRCSTIPR